MRALNKKLNKKPKYLAVTMLISSALGISALASNQTVITEIKTLIYNSLMPSDLYKNEHYKGGSAATELDSFQRAGEKVRKAQEKLRNEFPDQRNHRVFHAKQHACLTGKLNLFNSRPLDPNHLTYRGLFSGKQGPSFDILARFSNGVGTIRHDKLPDVRGLAIKIFDVQSEITGDSKTVDLLTTNSPTPAGSDLEEFIEFMEDVVNWGPTFGGIKFSKHHWRAGKSLISATGLFNYKIKSLATIQYWSGHPYLLGKDLAMKFTFIPEELKRSELSESQLEAMGENYLREDLATRLLNQPIKFIVAVQLEKNQKDTPIEDNLTEWTEQASPTIPVGELVIDQQNFDHPTWQAQVDSVCDEMSFTPGHYIEEHRPLSNMGRGRIFAYEASQIGRLAKEKSNPKIISELRRITGTH